MCNDVAVVAFSVAIAFAFVVVGFIITVIAFKWPPDKILALIKIDGKFVYDN